jgi:hypothetical protein
MASDVGVRLASAIHGVIAAADSLLQIALVQFAPPRPCAIQDDSMDGLLSEMAAGR